MRVRMLAGFALLFAVSIAIVACGDDDGGDPTATPTFELGGDNPLRQQVHWHADFALVIEGEPFDFNQPQYVSPDTEHYVDQYLHIHPERYTVVHVHREGSTWREFFGTFGWTLSGTFLEFEDGTRLTNDDTNTWKWFVNGVKVDQVWDLEISDLQRVLMVYGPETPETAYEMYWPLVTDEACISSTSCTDRIDPSEPPEICQGGNTCS